MLDIYAIMMHNVPHKANINAAGYVLTRGLPAKRKVYAVKLNK